MSPERQEHVHRVEYKAILRTNDNLITPEQLITDNNSFEAQNNIAEYLGGKATGNQTALDICADARVAGKAFLGSPRIFVFGSIAGGTPRKDIIRPINASFTKQVGIFGHYDSDTITHGNPEGCGGLHEKHALCNGDCSHDSDTEGLYKFVDKYLRYSDVLAHSYDKARYTATLTEKDVAAGAFNHLTGKLDITAIFSKGGRQVISALPIDIVENNLQKFGRLTNYEDGTIPSLKIEDMPDSFAELIERNRKQVEHLFRTIPNFSESQKVQNPHTISISSALMPLENRCPNNFDRPNSFFKIFIPQNEEGIRYTEDKIVPLLEQVKYPLLHTIKNFGTDRSFSSVRNLLIDTSNIRASENICKHLITDKVIRKWIEVCSGEVGIMASQVKNGQIQEIRNISI